MPATGPTADLAAFHQYVGERLRAVGRTPTPEEVFAEWELQHRSTQRERTVSLIQEALDDVDAGDVGISVDEHLKETRRLLEQLAQQ